MGISQQTHQGGAAVQQQAVCLAEQDGAVCALRQVGGDGVLSGSCNIIHTFQQRPLFHTYRGRGGEPKSQRWIAAAASVMGETGLVPSSASFFIIVIVIWFLSPAKEKQQSCVCPIGVLKENFVLSPSRASSSMAWPPLSEEHCGCLTRDKRLATYRSQKVSSAYRTEAVDVSQTSSSSLALISCGLDQWNTSFCQYTEM